MVFLLAWIAGADVPPAQSPKSDWTFESSPQPPLRGREAQAARPEIDCVTVSRFVPIVRASHKQICCVGRSDN